MKPHPARTGALLAGAMLMLVLTACGQAKLSDRQPNRSRPHHDGGFTIGLLLPSRQATRWQQFDRPLINSRVHALCRTCTVRYVAGGADAAAQQRQAQSLLSSGIDVLIIGSVDSRAARPAVREAAAAQVPVIAYDQLAEGPISGYVSFSGKQVGKLQGKALLKALGPEAPRRSIVMLNGSPNDPNSSDFKNGALSVLRGRVKIAKEYDVLNWNPSIAYTDMAAAISAVGPDRIDGVYAANDGLAFGAVAAMKASSIRPLPPVTGQDADLDAVRRIITGEQYMTVYKSFSREARAAAEMAVALGRGKSIADIATGTVSNSSLQDIPSVVLEPVALTASDIETVIKDGVYTTDQICTPEFRSACARAGLLG
ncbi:sugar ABC transporter substrate-binding protein [Streptomyces spirodelae]|uniref:Substrate-binding domain-containing protein n=1 Tax=Streptomyces spirodelae TaxID=2812904 RepID=A0ABS3WVE4_9ACTN|nr:substrate-binding domain-containing protein [Streptomyces spirodelae]MBO8187088.1 substrate-binding domain-containing protein [Streptomyces spirodelae]